MGSQMIKEMLTLLRLLVCTIILTGAAFATRADASDLYTSVTHRYQKATDSLYQIPYIEIEEIATRFDSAGLDSFIQWVMQSYHIAGVTTCAVKHGQMIWTSAHGWANVEDSIEAADTTLFMLASASKTVTGVALMQLWEQGLFGLDDNINNYLPFAVHNPNYPDSIISFRHLLTHTSSIADNWDVMPYYAGDSPIPLGQYLADYLVPGGAYYDSSLNFSFVPPGTQWRYCNIAIALAAYLVEAILDSFPVHCRDSIFTPLDMYETSWFLAGLDTNNIAIPHYWDGFTYRPYGHYGYSDYPSGQLRTSSLQLARFLVAFQQHGQIDTIRILDSATVELMTTIQYPSIKPIQGLVWRRTQLLGQRWVWGHEGGDLGVRTSMSYCPAETAAVVVLTNGESNDGMLSIADALYDYAVEYGIDDRRDFSVALRDLNLSQNYPNPFNRSTSIDFVLSRKNHVSLTVYNIVGQKVTVLIDEELQTGKYSVIFDAQGLPGGIYYYRLQTGDVGQAKRCVLVK